MKTIGAPLCVGAFALLLLLLLLLHPQRCRAAEETKVYSEAMVALPLRRHCSQSDTNSSSTCQQAVDFAGTSTTWNCSRTDNGTCWWRAVLERRAYFELIRIYNRQGCCTDGGHDFVISIDGAECAAYRSGGSFTVKTFSCGATGQVIQISSKSSRLVLGDIYAFGQFVENVKLPLSKCNQSSTQVNTSLTCDKAIDGNPEQRISGGSCAQVGDEEKGWWRAQIPRRAYIKRVLIFNLVDQSREHGSDRLSDIVISVDSVKCAYYQSAVSFLVKPFNCFAIGTVVEISSRTPQLTLCEVMVYGEFMDKEDILHLTNCSQSSGRTVGESSCHEAINGNPDQQLSSGSCFPVNSATGWWQGEIAHRSYVKKIRVFTAGDTTGSTGKSLHVTLDGSECFVHEFSDDLSVKMFHCYSIGSQIVISSDSPDLALCEVQAFGEYAVSEERLPLSNCAEENNPPINGTKLAHSCNKAIDGRFDRDSCARIVIDYPTKDTPSGSRLASWLALTRRPARIAKVLIYNQAPQPDGKNSDAPYGFSIYLDDSESKQCTYFTSPVFFVSKNFSCSGGIGSKVRIVTWRPALTLCEVQVFGKYVNEDKLTLSKCDQSSRVFVSPVNTCTWAINGDIQNADCSHIADHDYRYYSYNISFSNQGPYMWWLAKVPRMAFVRRIRIYDRTESNGLKSFSVYLNSFQCGSYAEGWRLKMHEFPCYAMGDQIKITSNRPNMTLCEVQAFGEPIYRDDILPLVSCKQSSTLDGNSTYSCDRATDSNVTSNIASDTCSRLDSDLGWWQAEVEVKSHIRWIRVYNMINSSSGIGSDALTDLSISVDGVQCASYQSNQSFVVKNFYCDTIGKTVRISSRKPFMTLCGVQMIGDTFFEHPDILPTVECRPNATHSRYKCQLASSESAQSTGPLDCSFVGYYAQNISSTKNALSHTTFSDPTIYTGWFQIMTYQPSYIRRVVITPTYTGTDDCRNDRLRDFAITVDDRQCASYKSSESIAGQEKSFDCNLIGGVVNIASRAPCKIHLSEVTLVGNHLRQVVMSSKQWQQPVCTRRYLRKQLAEIRDRKLKGGRK